ncbi:MAG: ATP-binding protein [Paludibacteraceae bacterium]|nr:ATP-binding protein [Paludibacteraceae bacterium]
MERKLLKDLCAWRANKNRMPLILQGARQVGKSWLLQEFGKQYYDNVVHINLETNKSAHDLFDGDLTPSRIITYLESLTSQTIFPEKTLLILDEIQACPRALTSLKSFTEEAPQYHIAAAGSLLGVAIHREDFSYPVGKVIEMRLYPLDFEEWLMALGQASLLEQIQIHFWTNEKMPTPLHEVALEWWRKYLVVGGMPAAVNEFIQSGSLPLVAEVQNRILNEYISDMAKYAQGSTAIKVRACYQSIPAQLAKENKKFQYKVVQNGGSSTIFGESIEWLTNAGVVLKCRLVEQGRIPLPAYMSLSDFKLYLSDVGLLTMLSNMPQSLILSPTIMDNSFMGAITENYVAQELAAHGHPLFYWKNSNTAELDFVLQKGEHIIPIEVKKGLHVQAKSLNQYRITYHPELSIRLSQKNFGQEQDIKSVPLYALCCV